MSNIIAKECTTGHAPLTFSWVKRQTSILDSLQSTFNPLTATSVYIYAHIKFPRTAAGVHIYARVEKSLYNRLFIGRYNLWLIRLLVQLFPKRVVVVLYIGFQFGTFYSQECYSLGYQNTDPKVEVRCPVAYHYSPAGGHMGQLRRITILQETVRLLGYPQAKLRFT